MQTVVCAIIGWARFRTLHVNGHAILGEGLLSQGTRFNDR